MNKISFQHGWNPLKIATKATKAYNSSFHKAIGTTPNKRWYGREILTKTERSSCKKFKVGDTIAHRNLNRNRFSDARD